jgi:putative oxidoreductase
MTTQTNRTALRPASVLQWLNAPSGHAGRLRSALLIPRVVAGVPLLGIGLMHLLDPALGMRPLVEAAGIPLAAVVAPLAVGAEILAGVSLLIGLQARIGALVAIVTMLTAAYSHLAIDVWPNGAENEPPLMLPIVVGVAAGVVASRGAGRWSFDARRRSG